MRGPPFFSPRCFSKTMGAQDAPHVAEGGPGGAGLSRGSSAPEGGLAARVRPPGADGIGGRRVPRPTRWPAAVRSPNFERHALGACTEIRSGQRSPTEFQRSPTEFQRSPTEFQRSRSSPPRARRVHRDKGGSKVRVAHALGARTDRERCSHCAAGVSTRHRLRRSDREPP